MRIFGLTITRTKGTGDFITSWPTTIGSTMGGWWPFIRESFAGAWQRGVITPVEDAASHPTFWACVTLIASDIAKLRIRLVEEEDGICEEADSSAFSPVLAKPNHYQNRIQFYTYWMLSKLTRGNTYVLKERDKRGVVTALYLLDPTRVRPMVSPSGQVYYSVSQDPLAGITEATLVIPAREIIHDLMFALYHPLCGLSPIYASGQAAMQGLQIGHNSTKLFKNGSQIGGIITAPTPISESNAQAFERRWQQLYSGTENAGKVAILSGGLDFKPVPHMTAVDAQLIDQLKWDDERICATFHVPGWMVGVGQMPNYNTSETGYQQYYSQCLQYLIESLELCLSEGLELPDPYDVEFDLDGLLRMDPVQQMESATKGVTGGVWSPNEARQKFNLPPVPGGETPYLQEQNYSLAALAKRDTAATTPAPPAPEPAQPTEPPDPAPAKTWDAADVLARVLRELEAA